MRDPRVWLGVAISAASLIFLASTVDFVELGATLASANLALVAATAATLPATMWMKAYRWRMFFPRPDALSMRGLLSALYLGYMTNTVVPLRAGEIVRAFLVGQTERVSTSTALATVLIEKVFDLGTIALLLVILGLVMELPDWARAAAVASAVGLGVVAVGLVVTLLARGWTLRVATSLEVRAPPLKRIGVAALLESFLDGLRFARDPRLMTSVLIWSVAMWLGSGVTVWLGLAAVGVVTPPSVALFVLAVTNLGMAVPSAPGYVGVFHSAVVVSLAPFGVDATAATAAAIVLHATIFGVFIAGGLYFLARGQSTQSGLGGLVAQARTATEKAH